MATLDVIPVTDFRSKAKEILENLKKAPIVLTQRGRPTAILIDYIKYREQEERLEELELALDDLLFIRAKETAREFISLDEMIAEDEKDVGEGQSN